MIGCCKSAHEETLFVRGLNVVFRKVGRLIARHPWTFIGLSLLLATIAAAKIPLTPMTNDVSDFTPYGARARKEIQSYKQFFSNRGVPFVVYVLVTAKNNGNMLGIHELEETILDLVADNFTLFNSANGQNESFNQFCKNFCTLNEPVRHFYRGFSVESNFQNTSFDHIDLSYPITTVLGRNLHMDPNFFGVKVSINVVKKNSNDTDGIRTRVVSVNELRVQAGHSILDDEKVRVHSNIREIKLIGLQFRAERPPEISEEAVKKWERSIVDYFQRHFKSNYVEVVVLTETFLTEEIVRAGLTLVPFLVIGFCVMSIFSSITMGLSAFYMGQMNVFKIFMAIMACVCPFVACGLALGSMFWMGLRFGSILCVTPFLVLAIGVDDAYLMVNAWQNVLKRKRSMEKIDSNSKLANNSIDSDPAKEKTPLVEAVFVEMIHEVGPSMTITSLTNVLAFTIGAFTPTPEIQLFSIGCAAAMTCDYIYQFTFFGSLMVVIGRHELSQEPSDNTQVSLRNSEMRSSIIKPLQELRSKFKSGFRNITSKILTFYCKFLTNPIVSALVIAVLSGYLYIAIYGILNTKAELTPEKLFLEDSDVIQILRLRNEYIMPFYAVCFVFVNQPGNISNPHQVKRLHALVRDFENLPSSLGQFSTKFWLRDYEEFIESSEEASRLLQEDPSFQDEEEPSSATSHNKKNELKAFLEWPEFDFWNGFVRLDNDSSSEDPKLAKFLFTTAFYGPELREWSSRTRLLNEWRGVADSYPDLEVTIFEDDAKFLDLIPTMVGQTLSSSICTLLLMFVICIVFMSNPATILVSTLAIVSTCTGVFGILTLWGIDLDPIVMSAAIMSIGFSVDIPAHIGFHFYKTGKSKASLSVQKRLEECLSCIGFPILEAGISTIICVLSLSFVKLHMAQVFVKTMVLVITLGLIHGLLIIPVFFYLISLLPGRRRIKFDVEQTTKVSIPPLVFPVNNAPEKL